MNEQWEERRNEDQRRRDRRNMQSMGGRRQRERRRFDRRKIAGAGLLAAVALGGIRYHALHQGAGDAGDSSVEVLADNFRIPTYDRAALEPFVQAAAAEYGLHPDLVRAVIQTESRWDAHAVSPVGAKGLMQLMPATAKRVGIENPFDPQQNIFGGARYLSMMMDRFKGNTALALAGYNAGPEKVKRHRGVPPYRETQGYVRKIQKLVADSEAAFNIPVVRPKARRASLRASARHVSSSRAAVSKSRGSAKRVGKASTLKARKGRAGSTPRTLTVKKTVRRTRARGTQV